MVNLFYFLKLIKIQLILYLFIIIMKNINLNQRGKKMKVGIVGASGYSGLELIRILHMHPNIEELNFYALTSNANDISDIYPHLKSIVKGPIQKWVSNQSINENHIIFLATPHGVSSEIVMNISDENVKIIDLSGDFRLKEEQKYNKWYKSNHPCFSKTSNFTYGLAEWNKEEIKTSNFIANPGCYPTASILAIAPLLKENLIVENSIIIDAKSGISGAGKGSNEVTHFTNRNDNFTAYKIHDHQHIPEIEQFLSMINQKENYITFTPHLAPMTRGIMATVYSTAREMISNKELQALYKEMYKDSYFIRIRDSIPCTKDVYGSNFCDIYPAFDERTNRITIISVIDNLIKGAAGQAIQNMNIMLGLPEETGLTFTPIFP